MATKLGDYSVRAGSAAVKLWPLNPGTTVAQATPPAPIAPVNPNPVVQPPTFAIFDVVVRMSDEPVVESTIANPTLLAQVSGAATVNSMPLTKEADGTAHICFAVAPSSGNSFEGLLRLSAKRTGSATTIDVDLKIKATVNTLTNDLFVFFVVHRPPPQTYSWVKLKVRQPGSAGAAVSGADVEAKLLRDGQTFRSVNRKASVSGTGGSSLKTGTDGYVAHGSRNLIGLPIDWPLLFNATKPGFAVRGHLIRLANANVRDNLAPFEATSMEMMPSAQARLAGRKIMLDPGHGVVYGFTGARRVNEWFVASRVADRIATILTAEHGVAAGDLFRTRTAGFGLIEPTQMGSDSAPEDGEKKFEYEMVAKRIRVKKSSSGGPAATLKELSDLLLTRHSDPANAAQPVASADRERLLTMNAPTLISVVSRLNGKHAPANRVRPGSLRWDAGTSNYVYTHEPIATPGTGGADATVAIAPEDWFTIDDPMLRNLIDRSVRWSLANEIDKNGPTVSGARPSFIDAARNAMVAAGAKAYMTAEILRRINVTPPHAYLDHGTQGWGPMPRMTYMNGIECDLYVTLHEDTAGGVGSKFLVSDLTGVNAPPNEQIRIGKIFIKYVDAFDQGLHQGGGAKNAAMMLRAEHPTSHTPLNTMRDKYAYLELEFVDAIDPANANRYRYEAMMDNAFIDRVARQIVSAIVETLLGRQSDLDSIKLTGALGTLW